MSRDKFKGKDGSSVMLLDIPIYTDDISVKFISRVIELIATGP